jgi:hypothetical protein
LAKFTWEQMHGPVPPGKRVVHADGNTLNDNPDNLVLMSPGEVAQLCHVLDPAMSEENYRGHGRRAATAEHNRLRGRIRRATEYLPTRWYLVDESRGVAYNDPHRSRRGLLLAYGIDPIALPMNGRVMTAFALTPMRGSEIPTAVVLVTAATVAEHPRRISVLG